MQFILFRVRLVNSIEEKDKMNYREPMREVIEMSVGSLEPPHIVVFKSEERLSIIVVDG